MKHVPSQRLTVGAVVASIIGGFTIASYAPVAPAAEGDQELQEVVVTGSRIARRDNEANSPLVTVDSAAAGKPFGSQHRVLPEPAAHL